MRHFLFSLSTFIALTEHIFAHLPQRVHFLPFTVTCPPTLTEWFTVLNNELNNEKECPKPLRLTVSPKLKDH